MFYSISQAETIINRSDIDDVFESIHNTNILNTQKFIGKDSVMDHNINISKYNSLPGSSYNQITKRIRSYKKRFD